MRILLGFDGSPSSRAALAAVVRLPWPDGTRVRAVVALGGFDGLPASLKASVHGALQSVATEVEGVLRGRWPTASVRLASEAPAAAILAEAKQFRADLVAVGWRGHGAIRRLLMGSVSRRIAGEAKGSVMVVRDGQGNVPGGRYVLGLDGSRNAQRALRFVARLAVSPRGQVLVHTALPPVYSPPLGRLTQDMRRQALAAIRKAERDRQRRALEHLRRAAAVLTRLGWKVVTRLTPEAPLLSLLEAARDFRADALVLGARGISGMERILLGSVAQGALDRARCPVIVVR